MLLHNYLEKILGSNIKVKILRTLFSFPTKTFTGRELAGATAAASKSAVAEALRVLESTNIVKIEHHGQSNLITLNRESEVFDVLKTLFGEESETFYKLTQELKKSIPAEIISCAIFGSVAKGTEKQNSDIDLLFITNNKKSVNEFIDKRLSYFISRYGNVIAPYVMTKKEFIKKKGKPLVKSILQKYVLLKGDDLWKILKQQK